MGSWVSLRRAPGLAAGVLALSVISATGQNRPESVVVTGQRDIDAVVNHFVELHAAPNRKTGQYMRDDLGPVCPVTLGLPKAFNDFVTARVLQVAQSAGATTDPTGHCIPNIEIIFTDKPADVVKALAQRTNGAILGVHFVHETPRLLTVTHPVQAWYVTGTRMDESSSAPVMSVDVDGTAKPADDRTPATDNAYHNAPDRVGLGSRLRQRRISAIANVLIVADIREVGGHEIGPVSDYIAMLALSEPRSLDQCNELPSILDLMSSGCGDRTKPDRLTDSDVAYLKALYSADLGATTNSQQKENIARGMEAGQDSH
jgi:hypothetical protein